MNLKKFKLDSYNKIIDDYKNNQDIYMFFLYPLILKLKTKDFKDYKYSIFLKLKNKQPVPFKEYTKKNLDKDIKIIIKCIFWSDYIDKNNIYAIYYLKKHLSTKKQTSINLINLLYRLLTNAPTKITGGGMFENARKYIGEKASKVAQKVKAAVTNKISKNLNTNKDERDEFFTIIRNFYNRNLNKSIDNKKYIFYKNNIETIEGITKFDCVTNMIKKNILYYNIFEVVVYKHNCYYYYDNVEEFREIQKRDNRDIYSYFINFIEDISKINEMICYINHFNKNDKNMENFFIILKQYLIFYLKKYYNFLDTSSTREIVEQQTHIHKFFMYIYMNNVYNIYKFYYINNDYIKIKESNVTEISELNDYFNNILKNNLEFDLKEELKELEELEDIKDDTKDDIKDIKEIGEIITQFLSMSYLNKVTDLDSIIDYLIFMIHTRDTISKYYMNKYYYIIFLINIKIIKNSDNIILIRFINKYNKKILNYVISDEDDEISKFIKNIMNIKIEKEDENPIINEIRKEIKKYSNKKKKITENIKKYKEIKEKILKGGSFEDWNSDYNGYSTEELKKKAEKEEIEKKYNENINLNYLIRLLDKKCKNIFYISLNFESNIMFLNPEFNIVIDNAENFTNLQKEKHKLLIDIIKLIITYKNIDSLIDEKLNRRIYIIKDKINDDIQPRINSIIKKHNEFKESDELLNIGKLYYKSLIYFLTKNNIILNSIYDSVHNEYLKTIDHNSQTFSVQPNGHNDMLKKEEIIGKININKMEIKKIRDEQKITDNIETIQRDISKFILNLNQGTAITGGNTKIQNTKLKLLIQHIISHLS
jgi:hypothetical protein